MNTSARHREQGGRPTRTGTNLATVFFLNKDKDRGCMLAEWCIGTKGAYCELDLRGDQKARRRSSTAGTRSGALASGFHALSLA